jgi:hypothetical protein
MMKKTTMIDDVEEQKRRPLLSVASFATPLPCGHLYQACPRGHRYQICPLMVTWHLARGPEIVARDVAPHPIPVYSNREDATGTMTG